MMRKLIISAMSFTAITPGWAAPQSAAEVIDKVQEKQQQRMSGVDAYFVRESTLVDFVPDTFLAFLAVHGGDGNKVGYRQVNPGELQVAALDATGSVRVGDQTVGAGQAAAFAGIQALEFMGTVLGMFSMGATTGPDGMSTGPSDLGDAADGLMDMAQGAKWSLTTSIGEQKDVPKDAAAALEQFGSVAEGVMGEIWGRDYYYLYKDGLNIEQNSFEDGGQYMIQSAALAIDKQDYHIRGMRFDGVAKKGKKTEPFFIQRLDRDFRPIKNIIGNDTTLEIPYVTEMIMGLPDLNNEISKKDLKELAKARKELAQARREWEQNSGQLDQLPPAQRNTIENQFNRAIEQAERRIRELEQGMKGDQLTMAVTKRVVASVVAPLDHFAAWYGEQMKEKGMATASGSIDSALEAAGEATGGEN